MGLNFMKAMLGVFVCLFSFVTVSGVASDHIVEGSSSGQNNNASKKGHPEAHGKVVVVPAKIETLEQFKEFMKTHLPKGSEPLLLLSGEKWCPNCVELAPRLKGAIPAGKVIFEIDTSQNDPKKNMLVNAIAKSKKFMKPDSKNELKPTRPLFPSLWRFDGELTDGSKPLVEEGVGPNKISAWLDNPPVRINNADWL